MEPGEFDRHQEREDDRSEDKFSDKLVVQELSTFKSQRCCVFQKESEELLHGRLLGLLAVSGLHVITMAGIYALLLGAMGKPAPWGLLIVIVALGNISTVVQITPGNVGVYDGMLAILGSLMGLAPADIGPAILAWRAVDTVLILVVGPVSSFILTGKAMGPRR